MSAAEIEKIAKRDFEESTLGGGLALSLPKHLLFDEEAFFKHYEDRIVDRDRERQLYILKRDGKRITQTSPKRTT